MILRSLIFFVLLFVSSHCFAQTFVEIRVDHASARAEPSSSSDLLAVLDRGEVREVIDDVPYWYGVRLRNGQTAYVAKSLCKVLVDEEEEHAAEEIDQPLSELYALPSFPAPVTIPNCTPRNVTLNSNICPPQGSGGLNALANIQKNRVTDSCTYTPLTVEQALDFKALPRNVRDLNPSDDRVAYLRALEGRFVRLEGFLAMVKRAGEESVNCGSSTRKDLHVEILGTDQGNPKNQRTSVVVTEVTPWFSEAVSAWTSTNLGQFAAYRNGYSGNQQRAPARVRIYGWLFFDNPHAGDGSVGTWRGTAWEVHPITRFEVFENGAWTEIRE